MLTLFLCRLSGGCIGINSSDLMINEEIRDREVRVVDENGEQLGLWPFVRPWSWLRRNSWTW